MEDLTGTGDLQNVPLAKSSQRQNLTGKGVGYKENIFNVFLFYFPSEDILISIERYRN